MGDHIHGLGKTPGQLSTADEKPDGTGSTDAALALKARTAAFDVRPARNSPRTPEEEADAFVDPREIIQNVEGRSTQQGDHHALGQSPRSEAEMDSFHESSGAHEDTPRTGQMTPWPELLRQKLRARKVELLLGVVAMALAIALVFLFAQK
jgi:hypothetical protein